MMKNLSGGTALLAAVAFAFVASVSAAVSDAERNNSSEMSANERRYSWRKGDFNLRPDSLILREVPGFKPIPFDKIGLYRDQWRKETE